MFSQGLLMGSLVGCGDFVVFPAAAMTDLPKLIGSGFRVWGFDPTGKVQRLQPIYTFLICFVKKIVSF
jgi:hypothetical protein